ncbi:VOC family protein [Thermodesulfobacteriota bacterium]
MKAIYKHTNIIANNWRKLADFYATVFKLEPVPPQRKLSGDWLEKGTGVPSASFSGVHLRLPGHGKDGPTLEIYQYAQNLSRPETAANREGISHLAFEVGDVAQAKQEVLDHGGSMVGEITTSIVEGAGELVFVYVADPEGNIIELQAWPGKK